MRQVLRWVALALLALAPAWSHAAISCTASGSVTVTVTDLFPTSPTNYDQQGTVNLSCTRVGGDPKFPATFWVGTSGTNGSRTATNGGNTVAYTLFTDYNTCGTAYSGTTGLSFNNAGGTTGGTTSINLSATFCMRISTSGQSTVKPLTFTGTETLTVKSTNSSGTTYTPGGTLTLTGVVNPLCKFPTAGTLSLPMTYTSFQAGNSTNNVSLNVQCTNTTSYTLSLDAVSGTVASLALNYDIGIGAVGTQTTGSVSGSGNAQSYGIYGRILSGQAGTCAVAAGCTGSSGRVLTVSY